MATACPETAEGHASERRARSLTGRPDQHGTAHACAVPILFRRITTSWSHQPCPTGRQPEASPTTIKAWRAVLPKHVQMYAVGGVTPANMQSWAEVGTAGFGIGSNIYKQGFTAVDVSKAALQFVSAWKALKK